MPKHHSNELGFREDTLVLVAHYLFTHAKRPAEIKDILREKHGIVISQQDVYNSILPQLIHRGWVRLATPKDNSLAQRIEAIWPIVSARVTLTGDIADVVSHAAYMISDLLLAKAQHQNEIHIGFAGGNALRNVFRELAFSLAGTCEGLINKTLVFHSLTAGIGDESPGSNPNAFFAYLDDHPPSFRTKFVLFHAPDFVFSGEWDRFVRLPAVRESYFAARSLDLIVTSVGSWADRHNPIVKHYEKHNPQTFRNLHQHATIGDMLWQPLNKDGPIDFTTLEIRPTTLLGLSDLPNLVERGTKVVVIAGPCDDSSEACGYTKSSVLTTILKFRQSYITHLVTDRRTAQCLLDEFSNSAVNSRCS